MVTDQVKKMTGVKYIQIAYDLITIKIPDMQILNSRSVTNLAANSGQISPLKYFTRYLSLLYVINAYYFHKNFIKKNY